MAKRKKAVHWQHPFNDFSGICGKIPRKARFTERVSAVTCKTCRKRLHAHIDYHGRKHTKQFICWAKILTEDIHNIKEVERLGWGPKENLQVRAWAR